MQMESYIKIELIKIEQKVEKKKNNSQKINYLIDRKKN